MDEAKYLEQGKRLYKENRYEEALEYFHKDVVGDESLFWRAMCLWHLDQPAESVLYFDKCIDVDPDEALPHYYKSRVLFSDLQSFELAKECIEQAILRDPDNPTFINQKGHILLGLNLYEQALEAFNEAISLSDDFIPSTCEGAIKCLINLNRIQKAQEYCEIWVENDVDPELALKYRAQLQTTVGDSAKLVAAFEQIDEEVAATRVNPLVWFAVGTLFAIAINKFVIN
ncbi:hypothetical protein AKO1_012663 [Acrasis kona]|uniref:Tetratricopeptide repeat protein n=1 Tax=Acrasis kona TaxID=1008807 RepID=A0AAW2YP64_9EUKA